MISVMALIVAVNDRRLEIHGANYATELAATTTELTEAGYPHLADKLARRFVDELVTNRRPADAAIQALRAISADLYVAGLQ